MKRIIISVTILFFILWTVTAYYNFKKTPHNVIINNPIVDNKLNISNETDLIRLSNPLPNQEISSPLLIEGEARGNWYFEASFPIKLYDENNNLIAQTVGQAKSDWMTNDFVPFKAELIFNSTSTNGILVLEKDNPSGLPENSNQLNIPIKLIPNSEKIKIKIFFNNNILDTEISCTKVFPVEREVNKTPAIAKAALTELLTGLTNSEKSEGFTSTLNSDIIIQSLNIKDGVAYIDFNKQLDAGVAGSCRVSAIRAQITETLKQFPSVRDVIISINGRTENILQP